MKYVNDFGIDQSIDIVNSSDIDFSQKIFDSIKNDYSEFNEWAEKIKIERRPVIKASIKNEIIGIAILKEEDMMEFTDSPLKKNVRLKICTFKIVQDHAYLGELFIKKIVDYALERRIFELYLTVLEKNDILIDFLKRYGFQVDSVLKNERYQRSEYVVVKKIIPSEDEIELESYDFNTRYYPSILVTNCNIFLVPSTPTYHDAFFVDNSNQSHFGELNDFSCRKQHLIEKKYYTKSKNNKIRRGDILIFCRSGNNQRITSIGVVTMVTHTNLYSREARTISTSLKIPNNGRSKKDISDDYKLEITFRHCLNLKKPIDLKRMNIIYSRSIGRDSEFNIPQSLHPVNLLYLKFVIYLGGIMPNCVYMRSGDGYICMPPPSKLLMEDLSD